MSSLRSETGRGGISASKELMMQKKVIKSICAGLTAAVLALSFTSCSLLDILLKEEGSGEEAGQTQGEIPESAETAGGINLPHPGTGAKSATVMVYMNGSDLESDNGCATDDITEMLSSGVGENANVIIQTMGTKKWHNNLVSADTAQTWEIRDHDLILVRDDLGQLDCTSEETLSEFIGFCGEKYPADRYLFIFWDHGGGPVYGFGYDEWQGEEASLTIDRIVDAFAEHPALHFDLIGMDCCIMAGVETCYALSSFCDYAVLSEDFESSLGWDYTEWMGMLEKDPGISTPVLGKAIIDKLIQANELSEYGDSSCVGLFKLSAARQLLADWIAYAYQNEEALLTTNFSKKHVAKKGGRNGSRAEWGDDESNVTLEDYYISDVLAIVESVDKESDLAAKLIQSLKSCVTYCGHTTDKNELTGIAVSLPYGEYFFYELLQDVYGAIGIDQEYIEWLSNFVSDADADNYYDYDNFENSWEGWDCVEGEEGEVCEESGDWTYDYEDGLWYLFEDGVLYFYDEEADVEGYYDEYEDRYYYYEDSADDWYPYEEPGDSGYGSYEPADDWAGYEEMDDGWWGY